MDLDTLNLVSRAASNRYKDQDWFVAVGIGSDSVYLYCFSPPPSEVVEELRGHPVTIRVSGPFLPADQLCSGCGLPEMHKQCPAHGTDVYCNPQHPDWGNKK